MPCACYRPGCYKNVSKKATTAWLEAASHGEAPMAHHSAPTTMEVHLQASEAPPNMADAMVGTSVQMEQLQLTVHVCPQAWAQFHVNGSRSRKQAMPWGRSAKQQWPKLYA